MMNYETARYKLFNRANLLPSPNAPDEESILFILYQAERSKTAPTALAVMRKEIIECLEVVNKDLNGEVPSETTFEGRKEPDGKLVYALSELTHACWEDYYRWQKNKLFEPEILHELALLAWSISFAWSLIMAGDFDSIAEDVELQMWGSGYFVDD